MNKIFTQVEEKLSVIIYVVMLAITFANVIGRYYFRASISATDEITTNIFVLLSVIGTGIAAKSRSHLGLSVLTELMPPKVQHIISGFANLLGTAFGAVLLYTGYNMVQNQIRNATVTPTLQWPSWVFGIFLPIGAVFIVIRFLQAALDDFKMAFGRLDEEEEDMR